jgi:CBS-domain-containing membrane protein
MFKLVMASVFPAGGEMATLQVRSVEYRVSGKTLTAVESNHWDPPAGLRRIRSQDLPKVGGIFKTAVVAASKSEALHKLGEVLLEREKRAALVVSDVRAMLRVLAQEPR